MRPQSLCASCRPRGFLCPTSAHPALSYILLFGLVLIFACALRPLLLFGILAGAALFVWVSGREVITIPGFPEGRNQLKGQAKHGASVGICLFVLLLFAGPSVFAVVGFSACLIGLHAVFYIPDPEAMHEEIETEKQMELP